MGQQDYTCDSRGREASGCDDPHKRCTLCPSRERAPQDEEKLPTSREDDLEQLAIRLAWMAFSDPADCTCEGWGDECPLCETKRVLGPKAEPVWSASDA